jgi:drug/metabolite transporter (DMT)-like permease
MYFYTLQKIPLASAVTIQFLSPVFTSILGVYIIKEKVYSVQWLFYLLSFIGLVIIQGFDPRVSPTMLIIGLTASVFAGLAYNFIRKINKNEHPLVIVFYFPLITVPLTAIYCAFNWVMPSGIEWFYLLLIGIFTQVAQYFMTMSYQAEDLSRVASIKYFSIVYALGLGYVFFDETFPVEVYGGITLIILGVIMNLYFKNTKAKE